MAGAAVMEGVKEGLEPPPQIQHPESETETGDEERLDAPKERLYFPGCLVALNASPYQCSTVTAAQG